MIRFAEEKARDALAFEPLPPSRWISVDRAEGILISVRYSEPLSALLRSLPQARWEAERRRWRYPFTSGEAIRRAAPEIERLAGLAQESADRETEAREAERAAAARARENERQDRERRRAMAQPRPLRPEFLAVIPDRPRFAIAIEAIADDLRALGAMFGFRSRCWVARIFGSDGRGGWARAFVDGCRDYSRANSKGSRGIYITYFLEEGPVYEISAPQTWGSTDRYFARVIDGAIERLTKEEVERCLAK